MLKLALTLLLVISAASQTGSIQIMPTDPVLYASTNYQVSYYTFNNMPSNTTLIINFNNTYIGIPNSPINITSLTTALPLPAATANCLNLICTIRLNRIIPANTNIKFSLGNLTNPYFIQRQSISTSVVFNSTYAQNQNWVILQQKYTPMLIRMNSYSQNNYGVGNMNITYNFNFTVSMVPPDIQFSITIPPQVSVDTIIPVLIFYGTPIFLNFVFVNSMLIFKISVAPTNSTAPNGFISLSLSGLTNPKSIGNSSSFVIQMLIPNFPGTNSQCTNCIFAQITQNVLAQSKVPGNIQIIKTLSSNLRITEPNNLTISTQLFASIPIGGVYEIILPESIKPSMPIYCSNGYGFILTNQNPSCSYNATSNSIYTNNFYFSGVGIVIITISIINPSDTLISNFNFVTFDANNNKIGISSTPYSFVAQPNPLAVTITKTNNQIEANFKLAVNMTLTMALRTTDFIKIILPAANYSTTITCISQGINLNCISSTDPNTNKLTLQMSPPCALCKLGTIIVITVDGLNNPSYISSDTQSVTVLTGRTNALIEQQTVNINLTPSILTITNYNRIGASGTSQLGGSYSLSFSYNVTNYIKNNGGQLILNFDQFQSYINPIYSQAGAYTYPTTLSVKDSTGNSYPNEIQYYSTNYPNSISKVIIYICGSNVCGNNLVISGVRKGFNPINNLVQNIQTTTQYGELVSDSTFSIAQFNAEKLNRNLTVSLTNSVTNQNSNYMINFNTNFIPFQSNVLFTLSSLHRINSGCFVTIKSTIFTPILNCQIINSTSLALTYNGDITLMMLDNVQYTITIINVTNPISIIPLQYTLTTMFNDVANQQFTQTYSIENLLPLTLYYTKTNNTLGQNSTLNILIATLYPSFDQIKLNIPAGIMTVLPSTSYKSQMINNIYEISQLYSLSNNSLDITVINPTSTAATNNITLLIIKAGFLAAQGQIIINPVVPVFLGLSASISSRVVGDIITLALNFNRINQYATEQNYNVNISSNIFDLSKAQYNNANISFPLVIPVGMSSIEIKGLRNLLYIPNVVPSNSITVWTTDNFGFKVAQSTFSVKDLVPTSPASPNTYSLVRTNTAINGAGSLIISYSPRHPELIRLMTVTLPTNQTVIKTPSCQTIISSLKNNCNVIFSNQSTITLSFSNQTITTLTNTLNFEPNANNITISMYTSNNQLVQVLSDQISPAIQFNGLGINANISSSMISTNVQLSLNIQTFNPIQTNYRIIIRLPNNTFLRIPSNIYPNCSYTISGTAYNNCIISLNDKFQVTAVNFTYLGLSKIEINSVISVQLYFTNYWAVVPFESNLLTVSVVNTADFIVNVGTISLINLYNGLDRLANTLISNLTFTQSSTLLSSDNTLGVTLLAKVSLGVGANLVITIPKSSYIFKSLNSSSNFSFVSSTENSNYYYVNLAPKCTESSPVCRITNSLLSFSLNLQNQPYFKVIHNPFTIQLLHHSDIITSPQSFSLPLYSPPLFINPAITRANRNAFENTNATIVFTLLNTTFSSINNVKLIISPLVVSNQLVSPPLVSAPTQITLLSSAQLLSYSTNSSNHIIITIPKFTTQTATLSIRGINSLFVTLNNIEQYNMVILDDQFIYYSATVKTSDSLVPYSSRIVLQRIITTVAEDSPLYLVGTFPLNVTSVTFLYKNVNYDINSSTFNISLGTQKNSLDINDATTTPIFIKNNNFVVFSSNLPTTPALTARRLQQFISFTIPQTANVSSNIVLTTKLNNINSSYFSITTPLLVTTIVQCCVDSSCSQNNILTCKITTNQTTLQNTIELVLKAPQTISNVAIQAKSLDYQTLLKNATVTIATGLPTSTITTTTNIQINPLNIPTVLSLNSQKVNEFNNYQLQIQPLNKTGFLRITLPTFIGNQLNSSLLTNSSFQIISNNSIVPANLANSQDKYSIVLPINNSNSLILKLISLINPINNHPFSFLIEQAIDASFINIYGTTVLTKSMTEFNTITIKSAVRTNTKFSQPTNITLEITNPMLNQNIIIVFPSSQVSLGSSCSVKMIGQNIIQCELLNSTAISISPLPGTNFYEIQGFINKNIFSKNTVFDLIEAAIGAPFISATTNPNSTTYITPRLTFGIINVISITFANNNMLSLNTITYQLTIEHLDIHGFVIEYDQSSYILNTQVECFINKNKVRHVILSSQKIFIEYINPTNNSLSITIRNILNLVKPASWSLQSVKISTNSSNTVYNQVDYYYTEQNLINAFSPYPLQFRVLQNAFTVDKNPITLQVIIDSQLSSIIPINKLRLNIKINGTSCELLSSPLNQTLKLSCVINNPKEYNILIEMYHQAYPNNFISSSFKKLSIYPSAKSTCTNTLCSSCSTLNAIEYCFKCNPGFSSKDGICSSSCQGNQFLSAEGICQLCSPTCGRCFGAYQTQCSNCFNKSLVLNSGQCQQSCPLSSFNHKMFCVSTQQCQTSQGCRTCSSTNFCYECLPDYSGSPFCKYKNPMPQTLMIFILLPFIVVGIAFMLSSMVKCLDFDSILGQTIFSLSFVQFFAWVLTIPAINNITEMMILLSFFVLRIFISIVSYEFFYKKTLGNLHQHLIEEKTQAQMSNQDTWKTKLVKFVAHFNGPDSYQLLRSKIAPPTLSFNHNVPMQIIFMVNRWIVCVLMMSKLLLGGTGDALFMPVTVLMLGSVISFCRLLSVDKVKMLISKCRS